jgi:translation initiation factor 1 (eIF-1/SUI1)
MSNMSKKEKKKQNLSAKTSFSLELDFPSLAQSSAQSNVIPAPTSWGNHHLRNEQSTSDIDPMVGKHADVQSDSTSSDLTTTMVQTMSPPLWFVHGTKNGGFPLQVEKRKHKTVTTLRNITGDGEALLSDLKRALGTGGKIVKNISIEADTATAANAEQADVPVEIEIQGDHTKRMTAYLCDSSRSSHIKGVSRAELAKGQGQGGGGEGGAGSSKSKSSGKSIAKLDDKRASLKQAGR